jgi:HK97 family phage portal protein
VREQRAAFEVPQIDPRDHIPNDNPLPAPPPGVPPGGTVGTESRPGEVMTGWSAASGFHAEAWAGWPAGWGTPWMEPQPREWTFFGYGAEDPAGYLRRVSTVMTCVDRNSRAMSSFPVYGLKNRQPVDLPMWYSTSPEPMLYPDWTAFMKAAVNSCLLSGECVLWAIARYADGWPMRFAVVDTGRTHVDDEGEMWLDGSLRLEPDDVCRIPYQVLANTLWARGVSPLQWSGRNLVSAAALEQYSTEIATSGVSAVLRHPQRLTAKQSDDLKAQWMEARYSWPGAPAVLSGGVEYDVLSLSPKDMALLDLKVFDLQMIAAAFGLPAYLINLDQPGGFTYTNANGLFMYHWRSTLLPLAQSFSGALSNWLLPYGTVLEFNPDRYIQPDFPERASAYKTMNSIEDETGRAITAAEVRVAERYAAQTPADEGEVQLVSVDGLIGAERQ